jgi:hypothetical protein
MTIWRIGNLVKWQFGEIRFGEMGNIIWQNDNW